MPGTDETSETGLHRSRLRLRGSRRKAANPRAQTARAVLSMVDLLSCAFGGALFLFILTAAPANQAGGLPPAAMDRAFLWIDIESTTARPIVILKRYESEGGALRDTIRIDASMLKGNGSLREVVGARSNDSVGKVWTFGLTPWEVNPGVRLPTLVLMLDAPTSFWCVRLGVASDDSSARERPGTAIQTKLMTVRKQSVDSSKVEDAVGAITVPTGVGMTECHHFRF